MRKEYSNWSRNNKIELLWSRQSFGESTISDFKSLSNFQVKGKKIFKSLSNSRWQNRKEHLNRSTKNIDMAEIAKCLVRDDVME